MINWFPRGDKIVWMEFVILFGDFGWDLVGWGFDWSGDFWRFTGEF
jgi:hypothetical protein